MGFLTLLKANPWTMGVTGFVILGLGIYVGALKYELGSTQGEVQKQAGTITRLTSDNEDLTRKYDSLYGLTKACNSSVESYEAAANAAQAKSQAIKSQAAKEKQDLVRQADWLREQLAKKPSCEAAIAAVRSQL